MSIHPPGTIVVTDDPDISILRELDSILCGANIGHVVIDEDGNCEIEWEGETKVYWDTQEAELDKEGRRIFEGDDGNDYTEEKLSVVAPNGDLIPLRLSPATVTKKLALFQIDDEVVLKDGSPISDSSKWHVVDIETEHVVVSSASSLRLRMRPDQLRIVLPVTPPAATQSPS